jgi:hypothetical protein
MTYLYGNSEPFPGDYDFITALDAFVTNAAQGLLLASRTRQAVESLATAMAARAAAAAAFEAFHKATLDGFEARLREQDGAGPLVTEYVRGLTEGAALLFNRLRAAEAAAAAQEEQRFQREIDAGRAELRAALGGFLVRLELPAERTTLTLQLVNGRPELVAHVLSPGGLEVEYGLSTAARPEWQTPRRVLEFVSGLNLPLDVKKGWLAPSVQQQTVPVADYLIGGFVLGEADAEIRLRRKSTEDDHVVIDLGRGAEGELTAVLRRPGDPEESAGRSDLDAQTRKLLGDLWDGLHGAANALRAARGEILSVRLDGEDVIAGARLEPLIRAVVGMIAPTVGEIARHSASERELSLKHETEGGRREEVYIKKDQLAAKLAGLSAEEVALFAQLGLVTAPPA